jgi:hypothetical protein
MGILVVSMLAMLVVTGVSVVSQSGCAERRTRWVG